MQSNKERNLKNSSTKLVRSVHYILAGMIWPFLVSAFFTFMLVHVLFLARCGFNLLVWPTMTLGLAPIAYGMFLLLPKEWFPWLRWLPGIILTILPALALYWLIVGFSYFFYFTIGGQC